MINYNIADLVSRINNNYIAGKHLVQIPYTKDNYQILTQLTKLGVVNIVELNNQIFFPSEKSNDKVIGYIKKQEFITIKLYPFCETSFAKTSNFTQKANPLNLTGLINGKEEISENFISFYYPLNDSQQKIKSKKILKVVSKPGKRVYISYKDIKDFNHGHKLYLLRTSKGIISSQTAIKLKIGGELLLKVSYSFN